MDGWAHQGSDTYVRGASKPSDSVHRHSLTQGEGRECNAVVEADVGNFVAFVDGLSLAKQSSTRQRPCSGDLSP
jgi:hypothetical protein